MKETTKGPWQTRYFPHGAGLLVVDSTPDAANGAFMGQVIASKTTCPNWEGNARLIATAPELLARLKGCRDALREAGKDFARSNPLAARPNLYELHAEDAGKAIAKAEGVQS